MASGVVAAIRVEGDGCGIWFLRVKEDSCVAMEARFEFSASSLVSPVIFAPIGARVKGEREKTRGGGVAFRERNFNVGY